MLSTMLINWSAKTLTSRPHHPISLLNWLPVSASWYLHHCKTTLKISYHWQPDYGKWCTTWMVYVCILFSFDTLPFFFALATSACFLAFFLRASSLWFPPKNILLQYLNCILYLINPFSSSTYVSCPLVLVWVTDDRRLGITKNTFNYFEISVRRSTVPG